MTSIRDPNTPPWKQIEDSIETILKSPRMFCDTSEGLECLLDAYMDCWTFMRLPGEALSKRYTELILQERAARSLGSSPWFHILLTVTGGQIRIADQDKQQRDLSEKIVIDVYSKFWKELKASVPPLVQLAEACS